MHLYVDSVIPSVVGLGPGERIGLWVQGCSLGCPGCMSPGLQRRTAAGRRAVDGLVGELMALAPGHVGITVSGGEPFEQPEPLGRLLAELRRHTDVDVLLYSGYSRREIAAGSRNMRELLRQADMLIDGRFREELPTNRLWRGSANQRMYLLSEWAQRYRDCTDATYTGARPLQVMPTDSGMHIIGIPERGFMQQLEENLRHRRAAISAAAEEGRDGQ